MIYRILELISGIGSFAGVLFIATIVPPEEKNSLYLVAGILILGSSVLTIKRSLKDIIYKTEKK